jgi:hypothetical protein
MEHTVAVLALGGVVGLAVAVAWAVWRGVR